MLFIFRLVPLLDKIRKIADIRFNGESMQIVVKWLRYIGRLVEKILSNLSSLREVIAVDLKKRIIAIVLVDE